LCPSAGRHHLDNGGADTASDAGKLYEGFEASGPDHIAERIVALLDDARRPAISIDPIRPCVLLLEDVCHLAQLRRNRRIAGEDHRSKLLQHPGGVQSR
jgi:hypothetical protein